MTSLYFKDARVTKYRPITHTSLQDSKISLPIIGGMHSCTRARNAFASPIMSVGAFDPPSYWYNLSNNNEGNLCILFLLEECIFLSTYKMWTHSLKSCSW